MTAPRWLDEEEMRAWLAFVTAAALIDRRLDQQLRRDARLSHLQYSVLARLSAAPGGALRMTDLADLLASTKSGLTYQVEQLEKAGLVCRRACDQDTRGVFAAITAEGRRRLEQAAPGHVAEVRELFVDVLSRDQLTVIADGLSEVSRRLSALPQAVGLDDRRSLAQAGAGDGSGVRNLPCAVEFPPAATRSSDLVAGSGGGQLIVMREPPGVAVQTRFRE